MREIYEGSDRQKSLSPILKTEAAAEREISKRDAYIFTSNVFSQSSIFPSHLTKYLNWIVSESIPSF